MSWEWIKMHKQFRPNHFDFGPNLRNHRVIWMVITVGLSDLLSNFFLPELANFFLSLIFGIIKRSLPCPCQLWHKISLSTFLPIKNLKNSMNDERNWSNTMRMEELSGSVLLILEFFLTSSWIVWICLRLFKILFIIVITILISQIIFVLFFRAETFGSGVRAGAASSIPKRESEERYIFSLTPDFKECMTVLFCDNALCSLFTNSPIAKARRQAENI